MNTLFDFLKVEGERIEKEFELASNFGSGTPQEVADFREPVVQQFLQRFFPRSFVVTKGKITDNDGHQSSSVDCLILNPAHPNFVDCSGKFRLVFADACDHAIEIKPDLKRKEELFRELKQGQSVKSIKRSSDNFWLKGQHPHIVEHSLYINFLLFSLVAFDPSILYGLLAEYYKENNVEIEKQIDGIFILGKGIIRNVKHQERCNYSQRHVATQLAGWYFENWGKTSLAGLLTQLEHAYKSQPAIKESVMSSILHKTKGGFSVSYLGPCITPAQ